MAFDALEYVRIEGEFLSLGGGYLWERVELVAWQRREYERVAGTAKQRDFRSRQHGRHYHSAYERARRVRNKERAAVVRCCPVCWRMWAVSAAQREDGKRFCTQRCAGRYRIAKHRPKPPRMVTIEGKTRALPEWAKRFGIGVSMVYRRIRQGMTEVDALTIPKAKGKR